MTKTYQHNGLLSAVKHKRVTHYPVQPGKPMQSAHVPYPEPRMDWDSIRLAKVRCRFKCCHYCYWTDGCRYGLLPNTKCRVFSDEGMEL